MIFEEGMCKPRPCLTTISEDTCGPSKPACLLGPWPFPKRRGLTGRPRRQLCRVGSRKMMVPTCCSQQGQWQPNQRIGNTGCSQHPGTVPQGNCQILFFKESRIDLTLSTSYSCSANASSNPERQPAVAGQPTRHSKARREWPCNSQAGKTRLPVALNGATEPSLAQQLRKGACTLQ